MIWLICVCGILLAIIQFIAGIYYEKNRTISIRNLLDVYEYCRKQNKGKKLNSGMYLQKYSGKRIALYGKGKYMEELMHECEGYDIEFECVADQAHSNSSACGIPLISPEELAQRNVDLIVITSISHSTQIKEFLYNMQIDAEIVSYLDIVYNLKRMGEKKKIAIASWNGSICLNYGCALQAASLQSVIKELGYEPITICFEWAELNRRTYWKKVLAMGRNYWKTVILFWEFGRNRINLGKKHISYEQCSRNVFDERCSILLSGSDSIWDDEHANPMMFWADDSMSFFPKIAYAPSGPGAIDAWDKSPLINSFFALSVRERAFGEMLKKHSQIETFKNRELITVLDPTLLVPFEYWQNMLRKEKKIKSFIEEKYLLCYFLNTNNDTEKNVQKVKQRHGIEKVYFIDTRIIDKFGNPGICDYKDREVPFTVGPLEFVSLIKNAEAVITDSYHGSMLSIVFHKQFYYTVRGQQGLNDRRFNEVFEKFNMANRFCDYYEELSDMPYIDYDSVEIILKKERKKSMKFLKYALETADNHLF